MHRALLIAVIAWIALVAGAAVGQDIFGPAKESADAAAAMRTWKYETDEGLQQLVAKVARIEEGRAVFVDGDDEEHSISLDKLTEGDSREALLRVIGAGVVSVYPLDIFDAEAGWASGFVVRQDGLILTNYHVVRGAARVEVGFRGAENRVDAQVLAVDRAVDVAFLKVDKLPESASVIEIAAGETPDVGSTVWTIGHPQGLPNTVSWGKVNAVRPTTEVPPIQQRPFDVPEAVRWIQTDAVIKQGSSGSPLLDEKGRAIGMNTFLVGVQLGFAVRLDGARDAYGRIDTKQPLDLPLPPAEGEDAFAWYCRELAPILKQAAQEYSDLQQRRAALPPEELLELWQTADKKYRHQYLDFAKEQPDGWPGLQALYYAAELCLRGTPDDQQCLREITSLLKKHHADRREMLTVVQHLVNVQDEAPRDFLRHLAKSSPHRDVQAFAALGLAQNLLSWLSVADTMDLKVLTARRQEIAKMLDEFQAEFKEPQYQRLQQVARQFRAALDAHHLGKTAPATKGVDVKGKEFALKDYRKKVVLLDFFGNWCPWCVKMYPEERKLVEELAKERFVLLGVNTDNQRVLGEIIQKGEVTWRCWADGPQGPITTTWRVESMPTLFLLDKQGIVRRQFVGTPDVKHLRQAIDKLLAE